MKMVVNETEVKYEVKYIVTDWLSSLKCGLINENISGIEDNKILIFQHISSSMFHLSFGEKPKKSLSSLRGKMTKQSEKVIDKQISNLRDEWQRNIL